MTIPFYMDENVPAAITEALRQRDLDVLTVQEDGRSGLTDPAVLDRAGQLHRMLFSMDTDLLAEASLRQRERRWFAGVVYAYQLRVTIGQCVHDLELIAKAGNAKEFENEILYLPL